MKDSDQWTDWTDWTAHRPARRRRRTAAPPAGARAARRRCSAAGCCPARRCRRRRALAAQLGVSRGVVVEAYAQLVAEGYLSARQGAATVVAARAAATSGARRRRRCRRRGTCPLRFDFRYGTPDLAAFPRAAWLAASGRALRALPDARAGLRRRPRGARRCARRSPRTSAASAASSPIPRCLMISGGTRHALGLVWRLLRDGGATRVAIEDPGWSAQHETAMQAGLEAVPVAVDEHGMRVHELDASRGRCRRADARAPVPDRRRAQRPSGAPRCWLGRAGAARSSSRTTTTRSTATTAIRSARCRAWRPIA